MFEPFPVEVFVERTGIIPAQDLAHAWGSVRVIASLRQLEEIDAIQLMTVDYLNKMLGRVVLAGGNRARVYEGCRFHQMAISPRAAKIGQRFIERKKYQALIENFGAVLGRFSVAGGPANIGAFVAYGRLKDGTKAIAHYIPPIVEMNGGSTWALLDGLHRNFIMERMGSTIPVIAVEGIREPFPCALHGWDEIRPVDEKPPAAERFFDLRPELFRDLKLVGIDG